MLRLMRSLVALVLLVASPLPMVAQASGAAAAPPPVTVGAFADLYFAWDVGRPASRDRPYTTQPARHSEFAVNLAHVEVKLAEERVRGRVALQAGTSVDRNCAAEPDWVSYIQEATVGARLAPRLWVDGGIYFSYIGLESWISRDNPTYTRSLIADYSPYYLAGAKLSWQASRTVGLQLHLVNGWQNVRETNDDKAVGARLDWQASPSLLAGYDVFVGNEQPDSVASRTRVLNQGFVKWTPPGGWEVWLTLDVGVQSVPAGDAQTWYGGSLIARKWLSERIALSGRLERYSDPDQVIVVTGTPGGFVTNGASLGLDVKPVDRLLWRTELRGFRSTDALWPSRESSGVQQAGGFAVTSLALRF